MGRLVSVTFRGQEVDVEIDYVDYPEDDVGYGGSVEWHFCGMTLGEHEPLAITDAERDAIEETLLQVALDGSESDYLDGLA